MYFSRQAVFGATECADDDAERFEGLVTSAAE